MARTGQVKKSALQTSGKSSARKPSKAAAKVGVSQKTAAGKAAVKTKTAADKSPQGKSRQGKSPEGKTQRKPATLAGGCLCGEIRYRITPLAADIDYCHCEMCRRWSGAPVSAWAQVPASQFRLLKGTATPYASSKIGIRYFCPTCGASVFMTDRDGTSVGIMLGTLDDAAALRPTAHGWWSAHLPWLKLEDGLPHWPKDPPYDG
ncbi:MAG TPA: GFA family protein [Dongiaceae bacterium]|nr:GFA family protein [Dongiaceae bacterium]